MLSICAPGPCLLWSCNLREHIRFNFCAPEEPMTMKQLMYDFQQTLGQPTSADTQPTDTLAITALLGQPSERDAHHHQA